MSPVYTTGVAVLRQGEARPQPRQVEAETHESAGQRVAHRVPVSHRGGGSAGGVVVGAEGDAAATAGGVVVAERVGVRTAGGVLPAAVLRWPMADDCTPLALLRSPIAVLFESRAMVLTPTAVLPVALALAAQVVLASPCSLPRMRSAAGPASHFPVFELDAQQVGPVGSAMAGAERASASGTRLMPWRRLVVRMMLDVVRLRCFLSSQASTLAPPTTRTARGNLHRVQARIKEPGNAPSPSVRPSRLQGWKQTWKSLSGRRRRKTPRWVQACMKQVNTRWRWTPPPRGCRRCRG